MIPAYKKRTMIAGMVSLAAFVTAAIVASASNPRDPGLGMRLVPIIAAIGGIGLLCTVWLYIKAKGRTGWWILVVPPYFIGLPILAFLTDRGTTDDGQAPRPKALSRFLSHMLWSSMQLMVALAAVMLIYLGWNKWDVRQLRTFCAEANERAAVSDLPALIQKYGFDPMWLRQARRDREGSNRHTYLPSTSTLGDIACEIHFNDTKVVSARMDYF